MSAEVWINWRSADGEERDERWPSVDAFRVWALAEGLRLAYRVYQEDEDGDLVLLGKGSLGRAENPPANDR